MSKWIEMKEAGGKRVLMPVERILAVKELGGGKFAVEYETAGGLTAILSITGESWSEVADPIRAVSGGA